MSSKLQYNTDALDNDIDDSVDSLDMVMIDAPLSDTVPHIADSEAPELEAHSQPSEKNNEATGTEDKPPLQRTAFSLWQIIIDNRLIAALLTTATGLFALRRRGQTTSKTSDAGANMDNQSGSNGRLQAAKDAISAATSKAGQASTDTAKKAGTALVTVAKRSPVPAAAAVASFYWLYRSSGDPAAPSSNGAASKVQDTAQAANGVFQRLIQDSPLAVGVIGLAIGAAIGLAIPETQKENELMGETRDKLADQAQAAAQDFAQKVGVVAATAGTAAQDALGTAKGAATGALGQVKDAATEALGTVKEEAKHQGLIPDA